MRIVWILFADIFKRLANIEKMSWKKSRNLDCPVMNVAIESAECLKKEKMQMNIQSMVQKNERTCALQFERLQVLSNFRYYSTHDEEEIEWKEKFNQKTKNGRVCWKVNRWTSPSVCVRLTSFKIDIMNQTEWDKQRKRDGFLWGRSIQHEKWKTLSKLNEQNGMKGILVEKKYSWIKMECGDDSIMTQWKE